MFKDTYLKKLMEEGKLQSTSQQINESLETTGEYIEYAEWRMGTCAEIKIKKIDSNYRVDVIYDYEFGCNCPTLERALQMAKLYISLLIKLDAQVGWPSNA